MITEKVPYGIPYLRQSFWASRMTSDKVVLSLYLSIWTSVSLSLMI